jgi:hypothetical protein
LRGRRAAPRYKLGAAAQRRQAVRNECRDCVYK